ncbi:MAG TPA: Rrf2 family transcriptional regulator [Bryobacterales bacterium]|jgi:Rrf2 family nitric oxide-sensitive transcriptional repressor|nr:Rrf2 family transcriptional regulator [Bryobacterales bacterium]
MFSRTAEYALRAMVWLAEKHGLPQTTQQIAAASQAPPDYLAKVLQLLGRAGLVRAHRGLHGGFSLARPPERLTILQIVNAVDPIRRISECPLQLDAHAVHLCPLHRRLDEAMAMIEKALASSTLAELIEAPAGSQPLCNVSAAGAEA